MKKLFFPLLLLSSTVIFAQNERNNPDQNSSGNRNKDVPAEVQQSFQREYPNAHDPQWNQTNGQWHANYKDNSSRNTDAYYDRDGNRRDTHIAWDRKDVPRNVDDRINRRYHTNGNYRVQRIERPSDPPLFQIRIQTGTRERTVYMDEQARKRTYRDHH